ncbi:hypothetical protein [Thiomicrospira microaerophila]|uniref:hypothetical protein n=1 Tax=Thiomicrospira microaerophila TaxID=406020 RepID=UPI0005CAE692|nr:hypothetical protein [Thiomicrospira microaerophila]
MNPSSDLQKWLDARDKHLNVMRNMSEAGGHISLRRNVYDADELEEPLKSEAKAYFEYLKDDKS